MNIEHIDSTKQLPSYKEMRMYEPPYFTMTKDKDTSEEDHAIACSVNAFRKKHGEPDIVYVCGNKIYIPIKEK